MSKINLSEYAKITLDDKLIDISTQNINLDEVNERVKIFHGGESFELNDILEGKFSGRTIAMGDKIDVLIKLDNESIAKLTKGMHSFKIESDLISNLEIPFELNNKNMNIKFDLSIL